MKINKLYIYVWALASIAACAKQQIEEPVAGVKSITVSIDSDATKTAFGDWSDNSVKTVWSVGDEIAVVDGETTSVFVLQEGANTSSGTFVLKSGEKAPLEVTRVFYPVSSAYSGDQKVTVPSIQTYHENTFDSDAAQLAWIGTNGQSVTLAPTHAIVCLQLKSSQSGVSVNSVNLTIKEQNKVYTLNCNGVELGNEAKPFYIVVRNAGTATLLFAVKTNQGSMVKAPASSKSLTVGKLLRFSEVEFVRNAYELLDYWPNEAECVGFVISVSDFGLHGKVISNTEFAGKWGPSNKEAVANGGPITHMRIEKPEEDPKAVTKEIIQTYAATLATDYPAFNWVHNLNGQDVDGPWYVPTRAELAEFYSLISGIPFSTSVWPYYDQDVLPGWDGSDASAARNAFKSKHDKSRGANDINLYGKYCSNWENNGGDSVWKIQMNEGKFKIASKTDIYNRTKAVREF